MSKYKPEKLKPLKNLHVLFLMTMLSAGCVNVTDNGNYCDIARPILPNDPEIDNLVEAGLSDLARRIDTEDEKYMTFCPKNEY